MPKSQPTLDIETDILVLAGMSCLAFSIEGNCGCGTRSAISNHVRIAPCMPYSTVDHKRGLEGRAPRKHPGVGYERHKNHVRVASCMPYSTVDHKGMHSES
eukprot:scaffold19484_cov19-Tisochrysis_lutea.AAC.1